MLENIILAILIVILGMLAGALFLVHYKLKIKELKYKTVKIIIIIGLLSPLSILLGVAFMVIGLACMIVDLFKDLIKYIKELL